MENPESGREYFGHGHRRRKKEWENDDGNRRYIGDILRGLSSDKKKWRLYDSPLSWFGAPAGLSYEETFLPLQGTSQETSLRQYIEDFLENRRGEAIAIDFGGPGSRVFRGFKEGFFKRTLGVTLRDERSEEEKQEDNQNGHDIIDGNMFDPGSIMIQKLKGAPERLPLIELLRKTERSAAD